MKKHLRLADAVVAELPVGSLVAGGACAADFDAVGVFAVETQVADAAVGVYRADVYEGVGIAQP